MGTGPWSGLASSGMWRQLRETLGANDRGDGNERVVAEVQKETGENRAGPGADKGENDAHEGQETDETHGPTQLRGVQEAEEHAGYKNAGTHAGAKRRGRFHAKKLGDRRKNSRQDRIQVTAKKSFLHERRNKDGHSHKQQSARAILEKFLDRGVIGVLYARAGDGDEERQSTSR